MSRLAKKSIKISEGVSIKKEGNILVVQGPKGEKKVLLVPGIDVLIEGREVWVKSGTFKRKKDKALHGTAWSLTKNAIEGVSLGFSRILEIEGVGYRAVLEGGELVLHLGYAVPVRFPIPKEVKIEVEKNVIKISGVDKELVGRVAANIRAFKKPEPYKGKGIHYAGEVIRRKVGKKAAAAAA
ncbi:MAG: 50S ribosomal protein L6 [bacterium]|nr:50S ribosomal protein L6 [bacterium]